MSASTAKLDSIAPKTNTLISKNPADGKVLIQHQATLIENLPSILQHARQAQREHWGTLTFDERADHLLRAKDYLLSHMDEIAQAITLNNGKPLVESLTSEVMAVIQTITYACKMAPKILRDQPVKMGMALPTKRAIISYEPLGVIGIISPWNYPLSTPMSEVVLGLIAGNAVILKPSEISGLVNEQMQKIVDSMQLPKGLVTIMHGGRELGAALAQSKVDKLIFTGSVATGKSIMAAASANLTPVTLELGGKDAMIVMPDANIDMATSGAIVGSMYNNGQTCASVERLLVHESIAKEFLAMMKTKLSKLRQGSGITSEFELGPISYEGQKQTILKQLSDHVQNGGKTLAGSQDQNVSTQFIQPMVVEGVDGRQFWNDETFGPVVAMRTFKTEDEAIELCNQSRYGLTAMIYSKDNTHAIQMARKLQVGTVVINDAPHTNAVSSLPWGGVKESGFGRLHGEMGLKALCNPKVISYEFAGQQKQLWWYPYNQAQYLFFKSFITLLAGKGLGAKIKGLGGVLSHAKKMGPRL